MNRLCIALFICLAGIGISKAQEEHLIKIPALEPPERIGFALYTVHNATLKMTVQFYPLQENESRTAVLQIQQNNTWIPIAETEISSDPYCNEAGDRTWTAHFRVQNWDNSQDRRYRIVALGGMATYDGLIRRDPTEKQEIVVAAFTGNSIYKRDGGDVPRTDIVANIKKLDPDLLFFSGDQVYDHTHHLAYWLRFGRDFNEILRNRPVITIPDDHDVGQGNLWGAGGKKSQTPAGHDGGYYMPAAYVKALERAQTWHLPDPFDPTPVEQDIGVYYTALTLGRISFAIIEDRKFKSGPEGLIPPLGPRPDYISTPDYDPASLDVDGAVLLGTRQLDFLHEWGQDWRNADMKAVLSQTIFCGGANVFWTYGNRILADLDSNGWPQSGRNKALAEMRRCFAVHIAGDQHLGTIFHHGIDDWEDAGFSFCVPSIANLFPRWWEPEQPGENRQPGMPDYTGRHLDGFGNRITCWAAANPQKEIDIDKLFTRAAGFGIVRFNKEKREITFECWPRKVDITDPETQQYPGWPLTIHQLDNYKRQPAAWLPTLSIRGQLDPVVQIIDESTQEVIYTLRIQGTLFTPPVFHPGVYTIRVGEGDAIQTLNGIQSLDTKSAATLPVTPGSDQAR